MRFPRETSFNNAYKFVFNKNLFFDNFQKKAKISLHFTTEAPEQSANLVTKIAENTNQVK